ncbi:hypothetical protein PZB74_04725 [Porifericola rhodea]|uniref:hypothetical protein n=1 Tax=Porifericola rhodea TaxID=930972 RepID=UPI002664FAA9|nr:hypothetical protein [Porifericola rhodea]WKN32647.1 hypothetical protein PZB74_04725 [Porifericola rhodea]
MAEDRITDSDFYQNYLQTEQSVENKLELKPIKASELPYDVLKSFAKSPFGKYAIAEAHMVPAKQVSNMIAQVVNDYSKSQLVEETYLLTLNKDEKSTQLRFNKKGKLIKIIIT